MAMAASPGRAAGTSRAQARSRRRVLFSDFLSLTPARGIDVSIFPISSSRSAISGGEVLRGKKLDRTGARSATAEAPEERKRQRRRGTVRPAATSGGAAASPLLPPEAMTFSSSISTELPILESSEASFDDYLDDRPRIFRAMFPDRRRSRQLNEEEWRIQMLPIQFLFASVNPVVVMRLRCRPVGSPEIHPNVSRALDLRVIRWELRGLEGAYSPPHFELDVRGLLYADRSAGPGRRSRLRGRLQMSISLVLPPVLTIVPEQVLRGVADSVLRTLLEKMKDDVNANLLSDFQSFRREKIKEIQLLKAHQTP